MEGPLCVCAPTRLRPRVFEIENQNACCSDSCTKQENDLHYFSQWTKK